MPRLFAMLTAAVLSCACATTIPTTDETMYEPEFRTGSNIPRWGQQPDDTVRVFSKEALDNLRRSGLKPIPEK